MDLESFNYDFPSELIATEPMEPRDASRLLTYHRQTQAWEHQHFSDLPELLRAGDLLVLNDTRVIPARLFAAANGREFEVFLLEPLDGTLNHWKCLARPGRKVENSLSLEFPGRRTGTLTRTGELTFEIVLSPRSRVENIDWLEEHGASPLPPYIKREPTENDRRRYQTVYANELGSVAAPTAGLHFTPTLFERLKKKGIRWAFVTLHVSYGTFSPIRTENIDEHEMHEESYSIPDATLKLIAETRANKGRIIPVGTTSLRTLESSVSMGAQGRTRLFIRPGHQFYFGDGLITNFHQPKSSLLVLVSAMVGVDRMQTLYKEAIRHQYRLFSYGDAMLIV